MCHYHRNCHVGTFNHNICTIRSTSRPSAIRSGWILFRVIWWENIINTTKFNRFIVIASIVNISTVLIVLTHGTSCDNHQYVNYETIIYLIIILLNSEQLRKRSEKSLKCIHWTQKSPIALNKIKTTQIKRKSRPQRTTFTASILKILKLSLSIWMDLIGERLKQLSTPRH